MAGQRPRRAPRTRRDLAPGIEALDARELLSTGLGPRLGHFVAPGPGRDGFRGRILRPAQSVDAHQALNRALASRLGPGLDRIERQVEFQDTSAPDSLSERVLAQPFVHALFRSNDTFTLLSAPWIDQVFAPPAVSALTGVDPTALVAFEVPLSRVQVGPPNVVNILPGDSVTGAINTTFPNGFQLIVPASEIAYTPNGTAVFSVPLSQIPEAARPVETTAARSIELGQLYATTGPLLLDAIRSGVAQGSPTGLPGVPGLRLTDLLRDPRLLSQQARGRFAQMMRVAVDRHLSTPNPTQQVAIAQGVDAFLSVTGNWTPLAGAQLAQAQAARPGASLIPILPAGSLTGTLAVSSSIVRPPMAGGPERFEVGYLFDRQGNYGLVLSARGPLSTTPTVTSTGGVVAGDVQVESSSATDLRQLAGWRIVEGAYQGSVLAGGLQSTNQDGLATFAASAGYGAGLEYGLGVRYTQIIPLGNVFGRPIG